MIIYVYITKSKYLQISIKSGKIIILALIQSIVGGKIPNGY